MTGSMTIAPAGAAQPNVAQNYLVQQNYTPAPAAAMPAAAPAPAPVAVNQVQQGDEFVKPNSKKKFLIGGAIVAGVVALALIIYNAIKKGKPMTMDAFKQAGHKFDKGIATMADGSKFTGSLTHTNKNGDNFVLEYADGLIKKSTKNVAADGGVDFAKSNFTKIFTRNAEGKTTEIVTTEAIADAGSIISRKVVDHEKGITTMYRGDDITRQILKGQDGKPIVHLYKHNLDAPLREVDGKQQQLVEVFTVLPGKKELGDKVSETYSSVIIPKPADIPAG